MLLFRMLYPIRSRLHSLPTVPQLLKPICLAILVDWRKRHRDRWYYVLVHGTIYHNMLWFLATYTTLYMDSHLSSMRYFSTYHDMNNAFNFLSASNALLTAIRGATVIGLAYKLQQVL